eukprot:31409-Pelagococcus_subviridis.AAC.3
MNGSGGGGGEGTILNDERTNGSADDFPVGRARAERALLVTIDVGARITTDDASFVVAATRAPPANFSSSPVARLRPVPSLTPPSRRRRPSSPATRRTSSGACTAPASACCTPCRRS